VNREITVDSRDLKAFIVPMWSQDISLLNAKRGSLGPLIRLVISFLKEFNKGTWPIRDHNST